MAQQRELIELRMGIEPAAARFAASRISKESSDDLSRAAEAMRSALASNDSFSFFNADSVFHRLLLEGSRNLLISKFATAIDAGLRVRESLPTTQLNLQSVEMHSMLAQAIANGDEDAAASLATQILKHTLVESEEDLASS
jgi:DNA-binding GntR family transcriptional regulator